jgi:hypothetical protein
MTDVTSCEIWIWTGPSLTDERRYGRPHLTISLTALEKALREEDDVIAARAVPGLIARLRADVNSSSFRDGQTALGRAISRLCGFVNPAYLTISLPDLEQALQEADAAIAAADVPGLIASLCGRAGPVPDRAIARLYRDAYGTLAYCDTCESQPCACSETPYIRFDYDTDDYPGVASYVRVPRRLVDLLGAKSGFTLATGIDARHIIYHDRESPVTRDGGWFEEPEFDG